MYRRGGFFIFAVLREDYHENLLNRSDRCKLQPLLFGVMF